MTAYDTQRIKNLGLAMGGMGDGAAVERKATIFGALMLYLDFVNLFFFLLRILGRQR